MANMFEQIKQAAQMRKEAKRIQAEIEKITAEYSNGGITVGLRGDFTVTSVKIAEDVIKELAEGKTDRFATMLQNVFNGAVKNIKQRTQEEMAKMMKSSGLGGLGGLMGQ